MKNEFINLDLFDAQQQKIINDCTNSGLDPSGFVRPYINAFQMQVAYHALRDGLDISEYLDEFSCEQLEEIRLAKKSGIDEKQIAHVDLSAEAMMMKRAGLEFKLFKENKHGS